MQKKFLIISLFIIIILLIAIGIWIFQINVNKPNTDNPSVDNIHVAIKDGTLTPNGVTLIVNDENYIKSNVPIYYSYHIYKKVNDNWELIVHKHPAILIDIEFNLTYPYEATLTWEKLEPGTYKIKYQPIVDQYKEFEFTIK